MSYQVRTAKPSDTNQIKAFLRRRNLFIHRHLDWRKPLDWIGESPFLFLGLDDEIQAILVCPSEVEGIFWIRLFAGSEISYIDEHFKILFEEAKKWIKNHSKGAIVSSIAYLDWMKNLLMKNGFSLYQNVVQLHWKGATIPEHDSGDHEICLMKKEHLQTVAEIDRISFEKIWHHSIDAIKSAYKQTSYSTVLVKNNNLIGFQMSTSFRSRAHIARLAVLPSYRGRGYGTALVTNMLNYFNKPRIHEITVNTQEDNQESLRLYRRLGFEETNEGFPILIHQIV